MNERMAIGVGPAGIDIAYECFGCPQHPTLVLLMGAGAQMINWPNEFCELLAEHGLNVVRFDNRDAGRSTHMTDAPSPDLTAALAGDLSPVPYDLSDMASDTVGLLDVLDVDSAHLVGASLGGMIAQMVAIEHPHRARSLTSMMATTGADGVGQANLSVIGPLGPPPAERIPFIQWRIDALRAVAGPGFPFDAGEAAELAALTWERGFDLFAMRRQAAAAIATGDRTERLRRLDLPTLVIHGDADPMCDLSGGRATADAVPGAELLVVSGMGHSIPKALWPGFAVRIADLVTVAEGRRMMSAADGIDRPRTGFDDSRSSRG